MRSGMVNVMLIGGLAAVTAVVLARAPNQPAQPAETETSPPSSRNVSHDIRVEIAALSAELETDSVDTGKLARLARLLHDGHQLEEAVVWYERYLAVDPTDRTIWLDLANCYAILERWEDALAVTLRHLERMPDDPQATYNLGAIYANRGQPELARQFWEQLARQSRDSSLVAMTTQSLARLR